MAKRSMRVEYGRCLVAMGKIYPGLVALEADLKESTQSIQFQQFFPGRYMEVGIAEQNMVGIAAGLALAGKIPVAHSFACFITMRSCEQVRTLLAYPKLNVKLVASHSGISAGTAGTTHHSVEDIAIMRSIPNMVVLAPGDVEEMNQAVYQALNYKGPVYIRLSSQEVEDGYPRKCRFQIGKATELRKGNDITIITTGVMVWEGLVAANRLLKEYGIKARVLQMASIKPIDKEAIVRSARDTGYIITVEEHNVLGGLGGAVAEIVSEEAKAKVIRIGINDRFCGVGSAKFLMEKEGLTIENIIKQTVKLLKK